MPRKPKLAPHLRIRLDAELLERVEKSRRANHRTLTGEIAHRLERSFESEDTAATIRAAAEASANAVSMQLIRGLNEKFGRLFERRLDKFLSATPDELPALIEDLEFRKRHVEERERDRRENYASMRPSRRLWRRVHGDQSPGPDESANILQGAEDDAVQMAMQRDPSLDERAAREQVKAAVEKLGQQEFDEIKKLLEGKNPPEAKRRRGLSELLHRLEQEQFQWEKLERQRMKANRELSSDRDSDS